MGYLRAKHTVGKSYKTGIPSFTPGAPPFVERNDDRAFALISDAVAEDKFFPAKFDLALMYRDHEGRYKNVKEAARWFRRAAEDTEDKKDFSRAIEELKKIEDPVATYHAKFLEKNSELMVVLFSSKINDEFLEFLNFDAVSLAKDKKNQSFFKEVVGKLLTPGLSSSFFNQPYNPGCLASLIFFTYYDAYSNDLIGSKSYFEWCQLTVSLQTQFPSEDLKKLYTDRLEALETGSSVSLSMQGMSLS